MKKLGFALLIMLVLLTAGGCGDGGGPPAPVVTDILSDQNRDQDISLSTTGVLTLSGTDTATLLAGIDPTSLTEYRAFLDFSLATVPVNADIVSATLDIFIDTVTTASPLTTIPIRIDLVSYPQPLLDTDFDRNSLPPIDSITISPPLSQSDVGHHVLIDVTHLMIVAQRQALPRFQLRILEDLGPVTPGLIEIEESVVSRAPLLEVQFL